ncbi:UNVERIFIED_CONTAM: Sugar transporter ERD6-like 5 [Sesamum radiatum]|uniref:Sugar transporter ERD6-like 5 n=1 Tax=Sesamum radiatum TaxID=300843 RepID=A0AAW2VN84_SESRA
MESGSMHDEVTNTSPLLPRSRPESGGGEGRSTPDSATAVLVLSTFVAVSGSYVFGCAVGYSSPAQSGILDDLGLTLAEYSLFGSISTIGAMIGAVVSGKIADLGKERSKTSSISTLLESFYKMSAAAVAMGFAELFNLVGWLAIAFSKNAWWLDTGRLSTGFGIGLLSYVVPVYIAEITPKNLRGVFTAVNQLMICFGASVMYLVGNLITWRILALIGTIPCLIQLVGLFFIPESPRWLDYTRTLEQLKDSRLIDLFQRKYAHSLIVGVGLMVLQQFGGVNAIAYYASAIFSSAGFSYRVGTTAMVIVQVSVAGTCLGCFLIGLSYLLQDLKLWDSSPSLALVGVLIFPINMKGLAGSLVTVVNWFGSWIITYSFNFLAQWSSAAVCGLTIIFTIRLVPETKGRTLEEIQASMISFGAASIAMDSPAGREAKSRPPETPARAEPSSHNRKHSGARPETPPIACQTLQSLRTLDASQAGTMTTVVVSSPEIARIVLQKSDQVLSRRTHPDAIRALDHHKLSVAWMPVDNQWRKLRKLCKEKMFSVQRLDKNQGLRREKLRQLKDYVNGCCADARAVDVGRAAFTTSLNLLSATLFSMDFAAFGSDSSQELRDVVWGIMAVVGRPNFSDYFPIPAGGSTGNLSGEHVLFQKVFRYF